HIIKIVVVGIDHDRSRRFPAVIFDDGATERLRDRRIGVTDLRQIFLVARLEVRRVGRFIGCGLHAARQHQARGQDRKFYAQGRHVALPKSWPKVFLVEHKGLAALILRPKRDDSVKSIILETPRNSSTESLVARCGTQSVAFLSQGVFWEPFLRAKRACGPIRATLWPPRGHKYQ